MKKFDYTQEERVYRYSVTYLDHDGEQQVKDFESPKSGATELIALYTLFVGGLQQKKHDFNDIIVKLYSRHPKEKWNDDQNLLATIWAYEDLGVLAAEWDKEAQELVDYMPAVKIQVDGNAYNMLIQNKLYMNLRVQGWAVEADPG